MATKKIIKNCKLSKYIVDGGSATTSEPSDSIVANYRLKEQTYVKLNGSNEKVRKITTISYAIDGTGTPSSVYKNASNVVISAPSESDWNSYTDKSIIEKWVNGYLTGFLDDVIETGEITISDTAEYYNGNNSEIFGVESNNEELPSGGSSGGSGTSGGGDDYILLEFSATNEVDLWFTTPYGVSATVDWTNGGDTESIPHTNNSAMIDISKTYTGNTSRTIKITGNVTKFKMRGLDSATLLTSATVVGMSTLTDASDMFEGCDNMTSCDLSEFDTSGVTLGFASMFEGCSSITTIDCSNFDTTALTRVMFYEMFKNCTDLQSVNISSFSFSTSVSNNGNVGSMFYGCTNLTSINFGDDFLPGMNSVTNFVMMFVACESLVTLDLSGIDTSIGTDFNFMFGNCFKLETLTLGNDFYVNNAHSNFSPGQGLNYMFNGCTSLSTFDISDWEVNNVATSSAPTGFANNAPFWSTTSNRPVWGYNPS